MKKFLVSFFLISTLHYALSDADLQQQNSNQDQLDPVNDSDSSDSSSNIHDKRTIFGPKNSGWAKHVGITKHGQKLFLGYSPVDLRYAPVIRPVAVKSGGYHYGQPSIHFRIKAPVKPVVRPVLHSGWKPVVKPVKPVVSIGHVDVVHQVPHVDHVHTDVHHAPPHVHHVHTDVHPVPTHVDHVHQVNVAHGDHLDSFGHVHHIHPAPDHVHANPVVPVAPVPVPVALRPYLPQPFLPSPTIFEVTKPNLGVLPFGATFPSPVLREVPVPHFHLRPAVPLPPPVAPVPVPVAPSALVPHPVPHPSVLPHPVPHPSVLPHPVPVPAPAPVPVPAYPPGTVVEYHGTRNFVPVLPQTPVNAVQPVFPPHLHAHLHPQGVHFNQEVPHQHVPQQFLHNHPQGVHFNQEVPHQHVPQQFLHNHPHFLQQLPQDTQPQFHQTQEGGGYVQQAPYDGQPNFLQQPLPLEGEHDFQQNVQQQGINPNIQYFDQSNVIQPGQTDLQLPLHLPQHPGFSDEGRAFQGHGQDPSQFAEGGFKPSIQLEAPYHKKRK